MLGSEAAESQVTSQPVMMGTGYQFEHNSITSTACHQQLRHIFLSSPLTKATGTIFLLDQTGEKSRRKEVKTFYIYLVCPDNFCNLLLTEILSYFSIYINWQAQSAFTYAANISRGKTGKEQRDEHLLLHLLQITVKNQREFVYDFKCQFGIKLHHANPS